MGKTDGSKSNRDRGWRSVNVAVYRPAGDGGQLSVSQMIARHRVHPGGVDLSSTYHSGLVLGCRKIVNATRFTGTTIVLISPRRGDSR